jgi:hypothetical protein
MTARMTRSSLPTTIEIVRQLHPVDAFLRWDDGWTVVLLLEGGPGDVLVAEVPFEDLAAAERLATEFATDTTTKEAP